MHTWLAVWFTSFLNFSAWEHFSLLWQTWARFCSDWTNPIKPLSVMLTHQLSRSECRLIREPVMADNPMSVTWRQELRSSSWRLKRTLEICDISSSDKELQPFSTRAFKGMSWVFPCKIARQYRKIKTENFFFVYLPGVTNWNKLLVPIFYPHWLRESCQHYIQAEELPYVYVVVNFSSLLIFYFNYNVVHFLWITA